MELPTEAIATWRGFAKHKPVLVLMSNNPFLQPIPQELSEQALALAQSGDRHDLRQRGTLHTADPLLLPTMALSAALDSGFFAKVVWVVPTQTNPDHLNTELFQNQLQGIGVSEQEAASFALHRGQFAGTIRGIPFLAVHPQSLPPIPEPALLHIDLSYFSPLYKGEIKTPLYPILLETAASPEKAGWNIAAVTISLSNLEGGVPLASRFVGADLATLLQNPSLRETALPENWERRANALFLENFFQKENIRDLYLAMERAAPRDSSIKFALYELSRQFNDGEKAMNYLHQAVQLDPSYALEYLSLAALAEQKGMPDQVLRMLSFAATAMPENPFISLDMAEILLSREQFDEARQILEKLVELHWSRYFYPQLPQILDDLQTAAKYRKVPPPLQR